MKGERSERRCDHGSLARRSRTDTCLLRTCGLDAAEVIYPYAAPLTTKSWSLNEADPRLILFVGRFDRHKGGDLIIDAFARVLLEVPDARLWFVGPDRGYIDANGRTWHIEEYPGIESQAV